MKTQSRCTYHQIVDALVVDGATDVEESLVQLDCELPRMREERDWPWVSARREWSPEGDEGVRIQDALSGDLRRRRPHR